jgi:hypothetical protein
MDPNSRLNAALTENPGAVVPTPKSAVGRRASQDTMPGLMEDRLGGLGSMFSKQRYGRRFLSGERHDAQVEDLSPPQERLQGLLMTPGTAAAVGGQPEQCAVLRPS